MALAELIKDNKLDIASYPSSTPQEEISQHKNTVLLGNMVTLVRWDTTVTDRLIDPIPSSKIRHPEYGLPLNAIIKSSIPDSDPNLRRQVIRAFIDLHYGATSGPRMDKKIGQNIAIFFAELGSNKSRKEATTRFLRSHEKIWSNLT